MSESSERTLNERLAILMGWEVNKNLAVARVRNSDGTFRILPDFEHSVDALKPVEEKLIALGWTLETEVSSAGAAARWWKAEDDRP